MIDAQPPGPLHAGCRTADVTDPVQRARIPLHLLYPTQAQPRTERFGPYPLDVALDAPPEGERLPLVVFSHGNASSPWVYRDLAAHLARSGFVVALPEHPGNSRSDNSLAGTVANLENRPRHLRLVIDAAFADEALGPRTRPDGVGVVGHSIGCYTGLAAAGGRPSAFPHETHDGQPRPVLVERDPRIRALVLLAPAAAWFVLEGSLLDVDCPTLMRTGALDLDAPEEHGEIIKRGLRYPSRLDHQVVPGAGHFSFQSPFPPAMVSPSFPPSQDPPGFDRQAYQPALAAEVVAFLRATLG